jgi:hypothetical protein
VHLTEEDVVRVGKVFPLNAAAGTRYPEHAMQTVNR